ncbi:MAG TPA: Ig-like domain-containing protein [Ruminiclostridium sp.]|nr:Ig-like domain-containing protein [Ruminiclostridium sp.]
MKHILKKLLSITIAVGLIITMIPAASFTASAAQGWSNVGYPGFLLFYRASSLSIVTDSSGTPYISFESASDKATVEKFNGKSWVPVGSAVSDGQADSISMTCYKDTLYVAYADYTQAHKATVKKFDGTDWVTVGTAGFSDGWANGCNLAFDSNGTPYIGYADGSQNYYGNATIKKFNGTDWVSVDMTNFPTYRCFTPKLAFNSKDVLYITYSNPQPAQNGRISVMKYDSTKWDYVGSQSFSEGQAGYTSIAFDSNDTPFVAFSNCITAASYNYYGKTDVMKYNASSNSWDYVGGKDFSGGTVADMSFVLYNDTPYVAYTDITNGQKMTVMKYNSASSEWESVGNPDFSSGKADYTDLTIDKNGTPYVIFSDYSNNMFGTVMSFGEMKIPLTAPTITLSSDTVNGGLSYTITPVSGETDKVDHYQIFVRDSDCTQFLEIDADASNLTGNIPLSKLTSGKSYIAFAQAISKATATNYLDSDPGAPSTAAIAVTATPDTTAPAAPTVKPVNDQNTTVTGVAEANSTVTVKDSAGKTIGTATADSNGSYFVTISAQTAGTVLCVTATDAAKNESTATKVTVTAVDTTAPAAPTVKPVNNQNTTVTGIAEANSTVTVKDSGGKTIGTATADSSGNYSVTIPAQAAGTVLCVTAADAAKNESVAAKVTVTATDTPVSPTPADTVINKIDALPDPDTASEKTIQDNQQNIKDTKQLYDALSSSNRDSIDSNRKNKLEKLIDRLDALLVIVPEDPNTGITAAGIGTAVLIPELADPDSGKVLVQLSVNKVPDTNRPANIVRAINVMSDNGKKVIATYDVSLLKSIFGASGNLLSSKKVSNSEIVGYITIRIPVPDDYSDNLNLTVAYIDDNGNVTPLTTTIVTENGVKYLQFTTNHFSEYAIIANSPSSAPTSPVSTSSATQTSSAAQDSISNPSTGHTGCENIIYVFLSCITALIAFRVFRRKKEREHF